MTVLTRKSCVCNLAPRRPWPLAWAPASARLSCSVAAPWWWWTWQVRCYGLVARFKFPKLHRKKAMKNGSEDYRRLHLLASRVVGARLQEVLNILNTASLYHREKCRWQPFVQLTHCNKSCFSSYGSPGIFLRFQYIMWVFRFV